MNKKKYLLYISAIALYIMGGIYSVIYVTDWIMEEYFNTLGDKAIDIAKIVANKYYITNDEAAELMSLDFSGMLEHPANKRFNELFDGGGFSGAFRSAYIFVKLNPEQVKYRVTGANMRRYDAPPGTHLNLLRLVNAVINQDEYTEDYYDDINRYSFMKPEDIESHDEMKAAYVVARDRYVNTINGFVPFYTVENDFVGVLGVDISFEKFEEHAKMVRLYLILIFMIPTIILTLAYISAYLRSKIESRLMAGTDPLTSLNNRRFLSNCMQSIMEEHYKKQTNLSVIMIDIDFFKKYNDNYGHQKGDEVLIKVSEAICSVLRHGVDIACRYGGEEIMVLLKNTSLSGAVHVAERIRNTINWLSIEHKYSDVADFVTVSQGIYTAVPPRADKKTEEQFIDNADKALYKAKNSGRNRYVVYQNEDYTEEK